MLPILADYARVLTDLHRELERTIQGLSQAALDWSPGPGMNSLDVLASHVAGAQRYWIGDVIAGDSSHRDRDAEFHTQGRDAAGLAACLSETLAHTRGVLERLTLPDLEATRTSSRDGRPVSVAWALAHALEHTALHLGQMQLTRQVWEQQSALDV